MLAGELPEVTDTSKDVSLSDTCRVSVLNEPTIDDNFSWQQEVSAREQGFRDHLSAAFEAQKGNDATRLWNAVAATWPPACADVLRRVSAQRRRGGRRWADLWGLIDAIEQHLDVIWDLPPDDGARATVSSHSAYSPTEEPAREMMAAADALRYLIGTLETAKEGELFRDELWDTCRLCWRFGARSRGDFYYCVQHLPASTNHEYKRNLTLLQRSKRGDAGFYGRLRLLRHRITIGLAYDSPSSRALGDRQVGEEITDEIPRYIFPRGFPWAKLPALYKAMVHGGRAPREIDSSAIFDWLCPAYFDNTQVLDQIRKLHTSDERLLLSMMIRAEVWIASSERLRKGHGGARHKPHHGRASRA